MNKQRTEQTPGDSTTEPTLRMWLNSEELTEPEGYAIETLRLWTRAQTDVKLRDRLLAFEFMNNEVAGLLDGDFPLQRAASYAGKKYAKRYRKIVRIIAALMPVFDLYEHDDSKFANDRMAIIGKKARAKKGGKRGKQTGQRNAIAVEIKSGDLVGAIRTIIQQEIDSTISPLYVRQKEVVTAVNGNSDALDRLALALGHRSDFKGEGGNGDAKA